MVQTHSIEGPYYEVYGEVWRKAPYDKMSEKPVSTDPVDPSDQVTSLPEGFSIKPVLAHNGVALVQFEVDVSDNLLGEQPVCAENDHDCEPDTTEYWARDIAEAYLAYLKYSQFAVSRGRSCIESRVASCNEQHFAVWDHYIHIETSGLYNATNPIGVGSATWTGIMTGLDVGSYEAPASGLLLGEAVVHIDDFSDPDVDVSFTGIHDVSAGRTRPNMLWEDLALTDGAFNDGESKTISGAFYGPHQQEAGGVFDRDGITGAFGVRKIQ